MSEKKDNVDGQKKEEATEKVQKIFTNLEEAQAAKPTDPKKSKWKLFEITLPNPDLSGYTTYQTWNGGLGVAILTILTSIGIKGRTVGGGKRGAGITDVRAAFAALPEEEREKILEEARAQQKTQGKKDHAKGGKKREPVAV